MITETNSTAGRKRRMSITLSPGMRFGRLTIVSFSHNAIGGTMWLCRCDCGKEVTVKRGKLVTGHTRSCGCLRLEMVGQYKLSHGHARAGKKSKTFMRWQGMMARCTCANHKSYGNYGGRGIKICERWQSFENFLADMGEAPEGMLLDRINNDGNYEPSNCRWVDPVVSANNRRPRRSTKGGAR